ncbi:MAG: hypothetical protein M3442_17605, partial [Chloroflexota bacterium]|nr:hypothetical protein [Chloroflexota bacterium]
EQESVKRAMRFDPPVPLDFEWIDTAVVVTPRVDLELASWYTLIIERTAVDIEGRLLTSDSRTTYRSIVEAPAGRAVGLAAPLTLVLTPSPAPEAAGSATESREAESAIGGSEDAAAVRPLAAPTPILRAGGARNGQGEGSTPLPVRPLPSPTRRAAPPTVAPSPVPATPAPVVEEQRGTASDAARPPEPGLPVMVATSDVGPAPGVTPTLSVTPAAPVAPSATASPAARPTGTARPTIDPAVRATPAVPSTPVPTPQGAVSSTGAVTSVATAGASSTSAPVGSPTRTASPGPSRTPAAGAAAAGAAVALENAGVPTVTAGASPAATSTRSTGSTASPATPNTNDAPAAILPTATTPRSAPAGAS